MVPFTLMFVGLSLAALPAPPYTFSGTPEMRHLNTVARELRFRTPTNFAPGSSILQRTTIRLISIVHFDAWSGFPAAPVARVQRDRPLLALASRADHRGRWQDTGKKQGPRKPKDQVSSVCENLKACLNAIS